MLFDVISDGGEEAFCKYKTRYKSFGFREISSSLALIFMAILPVHYSLDV